MGQGSLMMNDSAQVWIQQLDGVLTNLTSTAPDAVSQSLGEQLSSLDPQLLGMVVENAYTTASPEAAALLELIASQSGIERTVRETARKYATELSHAAAAQSLSTDDQFVAASVQESRHDGEQILLTCWRVPDGRFEACVFLLNWRGDGLKDYYRTRGLSEPEWLQLREHTEKKGPALRDVTPAECKALLLAAQAESQRFSRPSPREYKVDKSLIARRILRDDVPSDDSHVHTPVDLPAADVVRAYIAALHHRDYSLAGELLAQTHPMRAGKSLAEATDQLRQTLRHSPRREPATLLETLTTDLSNHVTAIRVRAESAETVIQPGGRKVTAPVRETFVLVHEDLGFRIESITPENPESKSAAATAVV